MTGLMIIACVCVCVCVLIEVHFYRLCKSNDGSTDTETSSQETKDEQMRKSNRRTFSLWFSHVFFFAVFGMILTFISRLLSSVKQFSLRMPSQRLRGKTKRKWVRRRAGEQRTQAGALRVAVETQAPMKPVFFRAWL